MAVPFRRTSKTTKRMRRTHFKLSVTGLTKCSNCGATIVSHRVCPECGYYDGKQVVDVKSK
ncbi:MAG: 50S ribosomal protein L32 [Bacilli bacterium]|nr:50S ribosomal protein L32 [Bacillales bacterium]MDY2574772.1 50S ribosomal protein L32 [Bacilli bacterium]